MFFFYRGVYFVLLIEACHLLYYYNMTDILYFIQHILNLYETRLYSKK